MTRLERWAKEHLNIPTGRRAPSQSKSRPPSPGAVSPQGTYTNHCPWIEIYPLMKLVKSCNLRSHRHNVLVSLSYDRLQSDTHCALQAQYHETTSRSRVNYWMEQFWTLTMWKFWVSPYLIVGPPSDTHCTLQVQFQETTSQVNWMEQIGTR